MVPCERSKSNSYDNQIAYPTPPSNTPKNKGEQAPPQDMYKQLFQTLAEWEHILKNEIP